MRKLGNLLATSALALGLTISTGCSYDPNEPTGDLVVTGEVDGVKADSVHYSFFGFKWANPRLTLNFDPPESINGADIFYADLVMQIEGDDAVNLGERISRGDNLTVRWESGDYDYGPHIHRSRNGRSYTLGPFIFLEDNHVVNLWDDYRLENLELDNIVEINGEPFEH
jgi:hypothetical protein